MTRGNKPGGKSKRHSRATKMKVREFLFGSKTVKKEPFGGENQVDQEISEM